MEVPPRPAVKSATRPCRSAGLALHDEEVQGRGFRDPQPGEDGVGLAAMMGLVVEQVREDLADAAALGHPGQGAVLEGSLQLCFAPGLDEGRETPVLRQARRVERRQRLVQGRPKRRRELAATGEPVEPDAVGDQQMVERAVEAAEVGAGIAVVVLPGQRRGRTVEARVGPGVIAGHHAEVVLHREPLPPAAITASASISTRQAGSMRAATCMTVQAGRILPKYSPWTLPTASQSP